MNKREQIGKLASKRAADDISKQFPGYSRIGDYHGGIYETLDFVSPWTRAAHNFDSKVVFFLQDWWDHQGISGPIQHAPQHLGYTPTSRTNINFIKCLKKHFGTTIAEVYVSNAFPFIRSTEKISNDVFRYAVSTPEQNCIGGPEE